MIKANIKRNVAEPSEIVNETGLGATKARPIDQAPRFWKRPLKIVSKISWSFLLITLSLALFAKPVLALCPDPNDPSCFGSSKVEPPSSWLGGISIPGLPSGGLDQFIGPKLVPFVTGLLLFLVIILSLIFLIIGGISWTMNGGNKEGVAKAKATVTYALIGLVLGLGSFIILGVIGQLLGFKFF